MFPGGSQGKIPSYQIAIEGILFILVGAELGFGPLAGRTRRSALQQDNLIASWYKGRDPETGADPLPM